MVSFPAYAAKRALVIGNDAYEELPDLQKAVADATAYEAVLGDLGYDVQLATNLSSSGMQQAIGEFIDLIEPGDEVAFVYAGHGWSDGSTNFIIGADIATKTSQATLRRAAIPLSNGTNGVIDDMEAQGARIVLAIIDACRNNPFESKLGRSGAVGLSRGLVLITGASGTFTVFSAGAGEEALDRLSEDDPHKNSVFSRVFLAELAEGGSLQDTILDTAPKVAELAESVGHTQHPAYYDGIGQRYCLTDNCRTRAVENAETTPEPVLIETPEALAEISEGRAGQIVILAEPEPSVTPPTVEPLLLPPVDLAIAPQEDVVTRAAEAADLAGIAAEEKPRAEDATRAAIAEHQQAPEATPLPAAAPIQEAALIFDPLPLGPVQLQSPYQPQIQPQSQPQIEPQIKPQIQPQLQPQLQPQAQPQPQLPRGGPIQFIVRRASPVRTVDQLRHESICSVAATPTQPTLRRLAAQRGVTHNSRRFPSLKRAIQALERSRCQGLAVPPRLVPRVLNMVRDTTRYVVLGEVIH